MRIPRSLAASILDGDTGAWEVEFVKCERLAAWLPNMNTPSETTSDWSNIAVEGATKPD